MKLQLSHIPPDHEGYFFKCNTKKKQDSIVKFYALSKTVSKSFDLESNVIAKKLRV